MTVNAGREMHQQLHSRTKTSDTNEQDRPESKGLAAGRALFDNKGHRPQHND